MEMLPSTNVGSSRSIVDCIVPARAEKETYRRCPARGVWNDNARQ